MLRGIYTAATGMINSQLKQDATADNIANASTTGFKQNKIVSKPFPEVLLQNMTNTGALGDLPQVLGKMSFGTSADEVYTDFLQGSIQETGKSLDFAINGKGFFSVQYFDGIQNTQKYTRDGSFSIDQNGMMVTGSGGYVIGRNLENNQVGPMNIGSGEVTVDESGNIYVDSVKKYSFVIRDFNDYSNIQRYGKNMYEVKENTNTRPIDLSEGSYQIGQGKLEGSNVDVAQEMVSMITNLRSYQASQRVLQAIDETLGKTVNEVGALG